MARKTIFAHTEAGATLHQDNYVGFLNVSADTDHSVDIAMREESRTGAQQVFRLSNEQARTLAYALLDHIDDLRVEHAVEIAYHRALTRELARG